MRVQHHRTLAAQTESPNVQLEHVLALPSVIPVEKKGLLDTGPGVQGLRAIRPPRPELVTGQSRVRAALREANGVFRVVWPYGTPLNVKTPSSRNPRTLPCCV